MRVREESSVLCLTSLSTREQTWVLVGLNSGQVAQYHSTSGELERSKEMHEKGVRVVRVEEDSKVMVTGSYDGTVKLWDSDWSIITLLLISVAVTDIVSQAGTLYICGDSGNLACYTRDSDR